MKKKVIASVVAVLLLAGGSSAYAYTKHVQNQELERNEQIKMEALKDAQKAVDDLYTDEKNKLAEDLSEEKIEKAKKIVEKLAEEDTKSDLLKEIAQVEEMFLLQKDVNQLFENDVLVDGVTSKKLNDLKEKLLTIKKYNESIYNMLSSSLEEASKQYAAVKKITEVVEQAEKLIDKDSYDKALSAVSTSDILNKSKKDHLLDRLDKVNEKLIALAEEKNQLEEAEKLAEVQAEESKQVQQQKSSTSSSNNVSNDTNKTISSPSKSVSNSGNNNSKTNNQSSKQTQPNTNVESGNKTNNKPNDSKDNTSNTITNVTKDGEGKFDSHYGADEGVGEWETGEFECNGCNW